MLCLESPYSKWTDWNSPQMDMKKSYQYISWKRCYQDRLHQFCIAIKPDRVFSLLMHTVFNGWLQPRSDYHPLLLDYWNLYNEMSLQDCLLFKEHRLIIPEDPQKDSLKTIHAGHFGVEKSLLRSNEVYSGLGSQKTSPKHSNLVILGKPTLCSQPTGNIMQHDVPSGPWLNLVLTFWSSDLPTLWFFQTSTVGS